MAYRKFLVIPFALLCGALAFWAVHTDTASEVEGMAENALHVLHLEEGEESASLEFTTSQTVEGFHVGAIPAARNENLSLVLDGGDHFQYSGAITEAQKFGVGRDIPAGTYTIVLSQDAGGHGGMVVIGDKMPVPTGMTGWQVLSRTYLAFVVVSGIWAFMNRRSIHPRRKAATLLSFHLLLLGFVVVFVYLLFHEGGHALFQIVFGHYDLSQSDFWGIHGSPHSGGKFGPHLQPWQHGLITGAGMMMPVVAGWILYFYWRFWIRRDRNPIVNLYLCATICMLVFAYVVIAPGYLLGLIGDGHFDGFITAIPGPDWIALTISWCILLVCAYILCRVVPEVVKIMKAQSSRLKELPRANTDRSMAS